MKKANAVNRRTEENVTLILSVWKRNNLEEQIQSILGQTVVPRAIWVWQNGNLVDVSELLSKYPEIEYISSSADFKYFGRFSIALLVKTKYVWILDDDVIPSSKWLATALIMCKKENAIISSAGRIIPRGDYFPEKGSNVWDYFFGDVPRKGSINLCEQNTIVDFGCNGWLFKSEWLAYFWGVRPYDMEMAEDIHLSATCKIKADIRTIVPRQIDEYTTGNLKINYGRDEHASWTKEGFILARSRVLQYLIEQLKWEPILWDVSSSKKSFWKKWATFVHTKIFR